MLTLELKEHIIAPALAKAGWPDKSSLLIVYGTGYVESHYQAVMQYGTPKDGGIGFFQMQPSTYEDICKWFKNGFTKPMLKRILDVCAYTSLPTDPIHLAYNTAFGALMCRVHYHRFKEKLPNPLDANAYANYHKKYYNSFLGKANVEKNTDVFRRIIDGEI